MRYAYKFLFIALLAIGCARVQVEAPKDPIKMDITMRLDVYQHVVKDIDDIENIVSGGSAKPKSSLMDAVIPPAHAAESLSPEVEEAAYRRRDRRPQVTSLEAKGTLGESRLGLLTARTSVDGQTQKLINDENTDRILIYRAIASKNSSAVEEIQKIYSQKLQNSAPSGTPVEDENGKWSKK